MIQANIDSRSAKIIMTNPFGVKSTVCFPCRAYMSDFIDLVTKQTVDLTPKGFVMIIFALLLSIGCGL
jgi:hypothetical protein